MQLEEHQRAAIVTLFDTLRSRVKWLRGSTPPKAPGDFEALLLDLKSHEFRSDLLVTILVAELRGVALGLGCGDILKLYAAYKANQLTGFAAPSIYRLVDAAQKAQPFLVEAPDPTARGLARRLAVLLAPFKGWSWT